MSWINYFEPKKVLNKWQFFFQFFRNLQTGRGWILMFGIIKLLEFPHPSEPLTKKYYKGFFTSFDL